MADIIEATATFKNTITGISTTKNTISATANFNIAPSTFLPSDLMELFQWIDLGSGVTLNGSDVSAITDRSTNGHNMEQTTASDQPLFVASDQNGMPAMQLDGISEAMVSTEAASVWKFLHDGSDYTIYTVFKVTDADPNALHILFNTFNASSANVGFGVRYDDRVSQAANNRITSFIVKGSPGNFVIFDSGVDGAFPTQTYAIVTNIYDNTNTPNWETLVNDISKSTDNNANLPHSSANPTTTLDFGGSSIGGFAKISVSEWFIYSKVLSSSENTNVIDYLQSKYAINLAGFDPATIPEMLFWAEARRETIYSDTDPVGIMTDQTTNGNDGTASGTNRPTYKTNILNGHAVYGFAVDDIIQLPSIGTSQLTLFIVFKATVNGILAEMSANGVTMDGWFSFTDRSLTMGETKVGATLQSSHLHTVNWGLGDIFRICRFQTRGTHANEKLFINNVDIAMDSGNIDNTGLTTVSDNVFIGGRSGGSVHLTGDIAAIGIASDIDAQDLAKTEDYLNNTYTVY